MKCYNFLSFLALIFVFCIDFVACSKPSGPGGNGGADTVCDSVRNVDFLGNKFYVYEIAPSRVKMALKNDEGENIRYIDSLRKFLEGKGQELDFAINGGMYVSNGNPCGLYIESGKLIYPSNYNFSSGGNFCMSFGETETNGIFAIGGNNGAKIIRTIDYVSADSIVFATQSGPLLTYNGQINTNFKENSQNQLVRNAVGVKRDGSVVFVISNGATNFYNLAKLFTDSLDCPNALYLDGVVSDFYHKNNHVSTQGSSLGVMIYTSSQSK